MSILSRIRLVAQQRLDLEDFNAHLSALRSDSLYWTKRFLSENNYIVSGFKVTGVGLNSATIQMTNSTLINSQNSYDFSWFTTEVGVSDIIIPNVDLADSARNYVEIELVTENNTPVVKAFWDPSANGGLGAEFNQQIDTITDLAIEVTVSTGGFSGNPNRLPLAIVDTDISGTIKVILDKRELFFRLGTVANPENNYTWLTKQEPILNLVLTGGSGTYVAGETVTFSSGATGIVDAGGTTVISVRELSDDLVATGDTLTGASAARTVNTITHTFLGGDSDITSFKKAIDAITSEIKSIKGTKYWYQNTYGSITGAFTFINSVLSPATASAKFAWVGGALSLTDDNATPLDSDPIAYVRTLGSTQAFVLTRQDSTGGSTTIALADGEVVYITLPASGDRTFSGVGAADTNYKIIGRTSFVQNDYNFWLAFREGAKLVIRGLGELEAGESSHIGDNIPLNILDFIGASDETDITPNYPHIPNAKCPYLFDTSDSLTFAIGQTAANVNGILDTLDLPSYDEELAIIAGVPSSTNELQGPISSGTIISLPLHSRSTPPLATQNYIVGKGTLEVFLNGVYISLGATNNWLEVGLSGSNSTQIQIMQDLEIGDVLTFRLDATGGPGTSGGSSAPDDDFNNLTESLVPDNNDYMLIWDTSLSDYRKQKRSVFTSGIAGTNNVVVNSYSSNHNADGSLEDVILADCSSNPVTIFLPLASANNGVVFYIKKTDITANAMTIDGNGVNIDDTATKSTTVGYTSYTIVCDGTKWWVL